MIDDETTGRFIVRSETHVCTRALYVRDVCAPLGISICAYVYVRAPNTVQPADGVV